MDNQSEIRSESVLEIIKKLCKTVQMEEYQRNTLTLRSVEHVCYMKSIYLYLIYLYKKDNFILIVDLTEPKEAKEAKETLSHLLFLIYDVNFNLYSENYTDIMKEIIILIGKNINFNIDLDNRDINNKIIFNITQIMKDIESINRGDEEDQYRSKFGDNYDVIKDKCSSNCKHIEAIKNMLNVIINEN